MVKNPGRSQSVSEFAWLSRRVPSSSSSKRVPCCSKHAEAARKACPLPLGPSPRGTCPPTPFPHTLPQGGGMHTNTMSDTATRVCCRCQHSLASGVCASGAVATPGPVVGASWLDKNGTIRMPEGHPGNPERSTGTAKGTQEGARSHKGAGAGALAL